jgi:hypothetical protein
LFFLKKKKENKKRVLLFLKKLKYPRIYLFISMKREMNQIKELFFFSINNEIIKFFFSTTYISKTSKKIFFDAKGFASF